ncbi:hypothetical protein MATL_G00020150 [Megalops atlanticus]|uniref:Cystatin domain-containing protein n=1 Tax=Megalops atlanticus TaxID=7932 RepID=A0A9D3QKZ6_MEGAT|nr:hypothetical protein MATL_G00020150 [Megalops atlanticus]
MSTGKKQWKTNRLLCLKNIASRLDPTGMATLIPLLLSVAMATALAGANSDTINPSSPEVLKAADYAISFHNRINNYTYAFKVITIQSASSQMYPPARVKYTMKVLVGETVCKNEPDVNLAKCSLQNTLDVKTMTCNFVVLAVPYSSMPSYTLKHQCN